MAPRFDPKIPFDNIPTLPPSQEIETKEVFKQTIRARAALAEFNALSLTIPNREILINNISLKEAQDSSNIENIFTTHDDLFRALSSDFAGASSSTKEIINYRTAIWEGYNFLQVNGFLSTGLFINLVGIIKNAPIGIRNKPGTRIMNLVTREVFYSSPENTTVIKDRLENLEHFLNVSEQSDYDPLVKMALIHYQFEAIHPFPDGNGRTGRIINVLYLVKEELLDLPIFFLSRYIIATKRDYYRLLMGVSEKEEWVAWVLYMLRGVEDTAIAGSKRIREIKSYMDTVSEFIKTKAPGLYSRELLEIIFEQPYTKIDFLVKSGLAVRQTASRYLKELVKLGILKERKFGKELVFLNQKLIDLLQF